MSGPGLDAGVKPEFCGCLGATPAHSGLKGGGKAHNITPCESEYDEVIVQSVSHCCTGLPQALAPPPPMATRYGLGILPKGVWGFTMGTTDEDVRSGDPAAPAEGHPDVTVMIP